MRAASSRVFRPALALLLAAWTPAARAFLGVGDVVFDPTNTAQTINVLHETQQQFDRLGSLLGVSTSQFDQLVSLVSALGNAGEAAPFLQSLSPAQAQAIVRSIPGLQDANLEALFNTAGELDAFLGVPPDQWAQETQSPNTYYGALLANPAIIRAGGSPGMAQPATAYSQWYGTRSPEDQANLQTQAAVDFSNLLTDGWLQQARQRRVNLQGLAAGGQDAQGKAAQAQTVTDQQHAQAQLSAGTNAILLESAAQNADATEMTVRAISAQNQILQRQDEARRDADELRLDSAP